MKNCSRRFVLKTFASASIASGAGILTVPVRAAAAEYTLKLSSNLADSHPLVIRAKEASARILQATNGRVDLQVYPNSQLGGDTDILSQLRSGAVDFMLISPLILGALIPTVQISNVGFAFQSHDQIWKAMDGDLGAYVRDQIDSKSSLFAFENIWENGYRHVTLGSGPVKTPDDIRGQKLRVMPSAMSTSIFKSLGASTVSINWAETYSALQTHVVNGQENPLIVLTTSKIYEVQKYCSLTQHVWDGFWCVGNKKNFSRMPADLQAAVRSAVNDGALKERADLAAMDKSLVGELESRGMVFNTVDRGLFQEKLRSEGYYQQWQKKFGDDPWALLQKYTGPLA